MGRCKWGVIEEERLKSPGGLSCDKGRSALHPAHGDEAEKRFQWERAGWCFHLKILRWLQRMHWTEGDARQGNCFWEYHISCRESL